ncbi:MAG: carbohydrate-binding family 9-like protein [Chthonomonas sp.]|nr:carbohydrate-binding family 9-like protein [Chthonomonas sp.]
MREQPERLAIGEQGRREPGKEQGKLSGMTPRVYRCPRADQLWQAQDLQIRPDDWIDIPWSEPFVDIEGDPSKPPRHQTQVKIAYGEHGLMILAHMQGPEIWATLTERDSVIFHDNDIELFLDPDGDGELYLELEMNALNTVWDLVLVRSYRNGGPPLDSFDVKGLQTAVRIDGELNLANPANLGWWAHMQIPYRSLKELAGKQNFPPQPGDEWRINFSRVHWDAEIVEGRWQKVPDRPEHNWVWSPMGEVDMHLPDRWGRLQFV